MSHDTLPIDITDDVLVRILDDQASDPEHAAFKNLPWGHAASARLWQLRESSERFAEAFASIPVPELPPMPTIPVRRRWLEAKAAVIALLLASGAAVAMPGTRALASDAAHNVVSWITGTREAPTDPQPAPGRATVSFVPRGAVFALTIESIQERGSLVLVRSQRREVTALAAADAELVVLPDELLIRNRSGSGEDIMISVPAAVTDLQIRIGGVLRPVSLEGAQARVVVPIR